jgi:hypothetical protein
MSKVKRIFTGVVDPTHKFDNPYDRAFNKKYLRAYLRGDYRFSFGRGTDGQLKFFMSSGYINADPTVYDRMERKRMQEETLKSVTKRR